LEFAVGWTPFLSVRTLEEWTYKKRQKTPKNMYVKNVTLNAANNVTMPDTY
jgi:hypothetical protein